MTWRHGAAPDAPGVARDGQGAIASPEMYVLVDLPMAGSGTTANVPFRGVGPRGAQVRRAKLFFLRELKGKAARMKEQKRSA